MLCNAAISFQLIATKQGLPSEL